MFYESDTGKDMREYFILRRGKNEITGDKLGDALTLTYKDASRSMFRPRYTTANLLTLIIPLIMTKTIR